MGAFYSNQMNQPAPSRNILWEGFLISFIGAIFFSTKAIIIKKAFHNTGTDALTLLTLRMSFALPFYIAAAIWESRKAGAVRMTHRQWLYVIGLGILGYYLSGYFDFVGLQYISAGLERLILFLYPSLTVLINAVAFRLRINRTQKWALVLTYIGIGIAFFGELRIDTTNPNFYWGSLLVFLCAITYAFYLVGSGRMIPVLGAQKFTSYTLMAATVALLLHFLLHGWLTPGGYAAANAGKGLWGYALLLAIVATVIPSFMLSAGMKRIGVNNAAIVTSIGPVSTILQAHFVLGDPIFAEQVIGTVLVVIGVLMIGWQGRKGPGSQKN